MDPVFVVGISRTCGVSPALTELALYKKGFEPAEFEVVVVEPHLESFHTEISARAERLAALMASVWGRYRLSFVVGIAGGTLSGMWQIRAAILRAKSPTVYSYHWLTPDKSGLSTTKLAGLVTTEMTSPPRLP